MELNELTSTNWDPNAFGPVYLAASEAGFFQNPLVASDFEKIQSKVNENPMQQWRLLHLEPELVDQFKETALALLSATPELISNMSPRASQFSIERLVQEMPKWRDSPYAAAFLEDYFGILVTAVFLSY